MGKENPINLIAVDRIIMTWCPVVANAIQILSNVPPFLIILKWFIVISNIISIKFSDFSFQGQFKNGPKKENDTFFERN
jgi:hypothetical protein